MEKQQNNERMIFIFTFFSLCLFFKKLPLFSNINSFLISGLLAVIGLIIGTILHRLVAYKSNLIKYGSLAISSFIILTSLFFISSYYKKKEMSKKKNPMELFIDSWQSAMQKTLLQPLDTNRYKPPKLTDKEHARFITCEICGYKALHPDSSHCYNCWSETFEKAIYVPDNKIEWLKNEQLKTFYPDDQTGKVYFYEPKIEEGGFKKDPQWKPSITEKEVIEFNK